MMHLSSTCDATGSTCARVRHPVGPWRGRSSCHLCFERLEQSSPVGYRAPHLQQISRSFQIRICVPRKKYGNRISCGPVALDEHTKYGVHLFKEEIMPA